MKIKNAVKNRLYLAIQYAIDELDKKNRIKLDCSLWGLTINNQHHLTIGGCDCVELAEKYGTPSLVVDKKLLERNYNEFYSALKCHQADFEIYYSYKTNPVPGILRVLHNIGAGAEVISPYELWLALKLGINPDFIIYNGPNKPEEGLRMAIQHGIKLININSFSEIELIENIAGELRATPKVGIRISTDVGWGAQFGFKLNSGEACKAFEKLSKSKYLQTLGIHVHLGTSIKNVATYQIALKNIFVLINEIKNKFGIRIKYLDLGGGYGVPTIRGLSKKEIKLNTFFYKPFLPPDIDNNSSIKAFVNGIVNTFQQESEKYKLEPPILLFEPGRAMTSNTEILLARIGDFKRTNNGFKIALIDAGINVAYPMTWEYHEIFLANKMNAIPNQRYGLAGPICTPLDFYLKSKKLPSLEVGDLLSIMDAGAYFTSFSNNFSFPRPAIIMVNQGKHYVIRERESYEDMVRLDK